jgi:hypothetical protein
LEHRPIIKRGKILDSCSLPFSDEKINKRRRKYTLKEVSVFFPKNNKKNDTVD